MDSRVRGNDGQADSVVSYRFPPVTTLASFSPFGLFDPWLAPTVETTDAFLREVIPPRTGSPGSPPAA